MSEWIDVGVYAALVIMVWFVMPNVDWRVSWPPLTRRNPDWLARPEAAQRFAPKRSVRALCYVLGTASVAALAACQLGWLPEWAYALPAQETKWSALAAIASASILLFAVLLVIMLASLWLRLRGEVPLPQERRATLGPRSIDDFVPRAVRIAIYALVGAHLAAWIGAAALGLYGDDAFWGRFVWAFALHGFVFWLAYWSVGRPTTALDRMVGYGNRAAEVQFAFAMQVFFVAHGALHLYQSIVATPAFDVARVLALSVALVTVAGMVGFTLCARQQRLAGR